MIKVAIKETNKIFTAKLLCGEEHNGFCDFINDYDCGNFSNNKVCLKDGTIICSQQEWDDFCKLYRKETENHNNKGVAEWYFITEDTKECYKSFVLQDEDGNIIRKEYVLYSSDYKGSLIELACDWLIPSYDRYGYYESDQKDTYKGKDGKHYIISEVSLGE